MGGLIYKKQSGFRLQWRRTWIRSSPPKYRRADRDDGNQSLFDIKEGVKTERMTEHTEIKNEIRNRKDGERGDKKYDKGLYKDEEIGR